ncbi:nitrate reductase molybdenum cofactor assembly chaperone [Actinomadura macrotermitis]|uniref:Nitrate reductase-like protein NarX n=1 Tax=Actinomadura macrotermitis TaxID=2585200 RepID=A0A7K0C3I0_9ACTN|nr:Nitrate reductase-like protein NarX [Actinomadura macrotermitis]
MNDPIIWQSAALLLDYPGPGWPDTLGLVETAVRDRPGRAGDHLRAFLQEMRPVSAMQAAERYVTTFDRSRRRTLYLTYYSHGDTRGRGEALISIRERYASYGWVGDEAELPDYLPMMLEFTARCPAAGRELLAEHRAGVELLRDALREHRSPYVRVVEAVRSTLPGPGRATQALVRGLARTGPPAESVGLQDEGTRR